MKKNRYVIAVCISSCLKMLKGQEFLELLSEIFKTYQGIPQGSVLRPTLFSLYLTGIERVVSPCQICISADDIIVWDHNSDLTKLENTLNDTLEKIQHFADEHKLAFNTTKSVSCLFTTNKHLFNYQPKIFLKRQLLESTKTPTYLGFTLDTEINCSKHINRLCEKIRKRLQLLKYISGRDWGADANTLKITYTALISVARIITGLGHSCPNDIVCYEDDLQPVSLRREINMANNVTFNEDLKVKFIKHEEHPELLRQLALEIIKNISPRALVIYTDGSKSDSGRTGSGIFMKTSTGEFGYRFRNPDHSSVFHSELIAISEALSLALDFKEPDVWILTDKSIYLGRFRANDILQQAKGIIIHSSSRNYPNSNLPCPNYRMRSVRMPDSELH
ncbi:putative RNA-directed DNA polymerase from transposon BS [Caerostris extrusa]|uniref:RNA-directed DNA polymerase from transposon BS n=1 Tax=Caerostris extrusa TaxID=172846 RepID=A0AAV4MU53_CAEEX|nr:putative RNA-directed DNA polymerase from transposon BS [Caerostris extrusa]